MSILSAYRYFFYRTYVQQKQFFGESLPRWTAVLITSLLLSINVLTLILFAEIFTGYRVRIEIGYGIVGDLILVFISYFLFLYNNKDELIISKFSLETEIQAKGRRVWCWIYEIGTFVAFFASVFILSPATR